MEIFHLNGSQRCSLHSSVWAGNFKNKAETKDLTIENSWVGSFRLDLMVLLSPLVLSVELIAKMLLLQTLRYLVLYLFLLMLSLGATLSLCTEYWLFGLVLGTVGTVGREWIQWRLLEVLWQLHFYLKCLVNQYWSTKLSLASAVRWESLSKGDIVWNCAVGPGTITVVAKTVL